VVGRDPECDVRIDSPRVSRLHCCLIEVGGAVQVRDLGSTNGVRINGRRMESGWLRPGDEFSVAHLPYLAADEHEARTVRADDPAGLSPGGSPRSTGSWRPPRRPGAIPVGLSPDCRMIGVNYFPGREK
jgi:hypothetical protein